MRQISVLVVLICSSQVMAQDSLLITRVGQTEMSGFITYDVEYTNGYICVADLLSGFYIYDVTDPADPSLAWFQEQSDITFSVEVQGNYSYWAMASISNSLIIYDMTDAISPDPVATLNMSGPSELYVSGNYAYVMCGSRIGIVDISIPESAEVISYSASYPDHSLRNAAKSGNYLYVTDANNALRIFDLSDLQDIAFIASYALPESGSQIEIFGNAAYIVVSPSDSLIILDISNPLTPVSVPSGQYFAPHDIKLAGEFLYVGGWRAEVYDLSNPLQPELTGFYEDWDIRPPICVGDDHLFAVDLDLVSLNVSAAIGRSLPQAPEHLVIQYIPESNGMQLDWSPVVYDTLGFPLTIDYYKLMTRTSYQSPWDYVASIPVGTTTYLDTRPLSEHQLRQYHVRAVR